MPFPLASPSEGSYREPQYQARIELYAQNHFTPAEYQKIKSRGITFCRGDADNIRHAFIGEPTIKRKVQLFTGSAYVYDLAHGLLLQVKRTVQQLINVPEGLDIPTLMAVLFNLRGYKLIRVDAPAVGQNAPGPLPGRPIPPDREGKAEAQLQALSTTDFKEIADRGWTTIKGVYYRPVRVPLAIEPATTYPWSLTSTGRVAADCVVAQLLEVCKDRTISPTWFSVAQRAGVFVPLELDEPLGFGTHQAMQGQRQAMDDQGYFGANVTYGYRGGDGIAAPGPAVLNAHQVRGGFDNVIRTIQLTQGSSFGPTSVAGLDEVFQMESERDAIIAMLTQWGTTGMGLILDRNVPYGNYRTGRGGPYGRNQYGPDLDDSEAIMGNQAAYSQFAAANNMGSNCGPGYSQLWYTGDPNNEKSKEVPATIVVNGVEYKNPRAQVAVCAPMTRQLRSMPYTKDVVTNPVMGIAAQRRHKRRKPRAAAQRRTRAKKTTRRRR